MRTENASGAATREEVMSDVAIRMILGIDKPVPLAPSLMARNLRVTFFPSRSPSPRLQKFAQHLGIAMQECGVDVLPFDRALEEGSGGKIKEGIVIIAVGELEAGHLPVDHVSNLRKTTVVGIVEGPCPALTRSGLQEKLNSIVETLAWNIVQVAIFVEEKRWTITTMNGAVIPCTDDSSFSRDVFLTLIPKLAAPVVPPHAADFDVEEGELDLSSDSMATYVRDFEESGPLWAKTGLLLFHTSLASLRFRNMFYRRIAAAYLDKRSGMSYGFLARQLATPLPPALASAEASAMLRSDRWKQDGYAWHRDTLHVAVHLDNESYLVCVPPVFVLTTRSGCDKAHLDGTKDLNLISLVKGRMGVKTPGGLASGVDSRPSYDTQTILAHALGNALIAAIQDRLAENPFSSGLRDSGVALAHWHGGIAHALVPEGYCVFGEDNPPVSCSTHQAAIYALTGKLSAFRRCVATGVHYRGDVHIEPHHGVNVTWPTLTGLAERLLQIGDARDPDREQAAALAERQ